MNRPQSLLLAVAALDIVVMLLFPPYDSMVMGKGAANFDAYYFVFDRQYNKTINTDLLFRAYERATIGLTDRATTAEKHKQRERIAVNVERVFHDVMPCRADGMHE